MAMAPINRRSALNALGMTAAALAFTRSGSALAVDAAPTDFSMVDPELRPVAAQIVKMVASTPGFSDKTLPILRAGAKNWTKPPLADVPWRSVMVPVGKGQPDVKILVINARPRQGRGGIVYMHGGGYVAGGALLEIDRAQALARTLDCTVVSVEYRLAPETRYLGAIEDNYAALKWTALHAEEIGIDPKRIVVMGESAGGGHAAMLAITARDRGEVPVAFQCLVYPMLDDRTGTTRPVPPRIGTLLWTPKENAFGWRSLLGRMPGTADAAGVPGRVADVAGLPPAWIGVGSIDLFVEEDIAYATRLIDASIPTELMVVPGAFHGFDIIGAATGPAKRFTASKIEALSRAIGGALQVG